MRVLGGYVWCFLLLAAVSAIADPGNAPAPAAVTPGPWEGAIQKFEAEDNAYPPTAENIVFVGSSTIRLWDLNRDFPEWHAINRGFGGSTYEGLADNAPRIFAAHHPRLVVVYSGDNDISKGQTPEEVFGHFKRFANWLREQRPETRLIILSTKLSIKRLESYPKMAEFNEKVRAWTKDNPWTTFLDTEPLIKGADGKVRADYYQDDGLHLNEAGYNAWAELVKQAVK